MQKKVLLSILDKSPQLILPPDHVSEIKVICVKFDLDYLLTGKPYTITY